VDPEHPDRDRESRPEPLNSIVDRKAERKLRAQRERPRSLWYGLGMFGLVGWSVAIPTLIGVAIGLWFDANYPSPISWTLTGLGIGILIGCLNAWFWVQREGRV